MPCRTPNSVTAAAMQQCANIKESRRPAKVSDQPRGDRCTANIRAAAVE